ncbi:hypothetical protein M5K25_010946 [Dendrobium thyrsiflorum]|uniref:Uncharacterized protein n=1 Tax=Dendrobium thyrsiflorum TaxID=117978 RepID=A0ABD0V1L4_DENTH
MDPSDILDQALALCELKQKRCGWLEGLRKRCQRRRRKFGSELVSGRRRPGFVDWRANGFLELSLIGEVKAMSQETDVEESLVAIEALPRIYGKRHESSGISGILRQDEVFRTSAGFVGFGRAEVETWFKQFAYSHMVVVESLALELLSGHAWVRCVLGHSLFAVFKFGQADTELFSFTVFEFGQASIESSHSLFRFGQVDIELFSFAIFEFGQANVEFPFSGWVPDRVNVKLPLPLLFTHCFDLVRQIVGLSFLLLTHCFNLVRWVLSLPHSLFRSGQVYFCISVALAAASLDLSWFCARKRAECPFLSQSSSVRRRLEPRLLDSLNLRLLSLVRLIRPNQRKTESPLQLRLSRFREPQARPSAPIPLSLSRPSRCQEPRRRTSRNIPPPSTPEPRPTSFPICLCSSQTRTAAPPVPLLPSTPVKRSRSSPCLLLCRTGQMLKPARFHLQGKKTNRPGSPLPVSRIVQVPSLFARQETPACRLSVPPTPSPDTPSQALAEPPAILLLQGQKRFYN